MLMMKVDVPSVTPITAESVSGSVLMGVVPEICPRDERDAERVHGHAREKQKDLCKQIFPGIGPVRALNGGCHAMAQCL